MQKPYYWPSEHTKMSVAVSNAFKRAFTENSNNEDCCATLFFSPDVSGLPPESGFTRWKYEKLSEEWREFSKSPLTLREILRIGQPLLTGLNPESGLLSQRLTRAPFEQKPLLSSFLLRLPLGITKNGYASTLNSNRQS